jgi:hypothetical protein
VIDAWGKIFGRKVPSSKQKASTKGKSQVQSAKGKYKRQKASAKGKKQMQSQA